MPLTKEEFEEACRLICPHCRGDLLPQQRKDTKEWVHTTSQKGLVTTTLCWVNGLRNSRFADES